MLHSNGIAAALHREDVHPPIPLGDEGGVCQGNDWALGFMRGVGMRRHAGAKLFHDEESSCRLFPALILCHEHDEAPELRPRSIDAKKREEIIVDIPTTQQLTHAVIARWQVFKAVHAGWDKIGESVTF